MRYVLPVIHFLNAQTALQEADVAFACGADGVFLISHHGDDDALFEPATAIKGRHRDRIVGLNLLGRTAIDCLSAVVDLGLDAAWADYAGVTSTHVTAMADEIAGVLKTNRALQFFGSVAFKGQPHEADPAGAALAASNRGMIACTSGSRTGSAPEFAKITRMRAALGPETPLAIASGMAPETVHLYTGAATHFLVSTHVSRDGYHFDPVRLRQFVSVVTGR
ncbi:hypothetical protein [Paraburkholderia sp. SIMBA_054]|uniref:hypothetical protein n=1 Tax=Paraburkholderia sp. SIMBA_054 TaxID=3085795 RepID=UPI00397A4578